MCSGADLDDYVVSPICYSSGFFLTLMFRAGSVLCIIDTAMGPWSLLGVLDVVPTQALIVPAVRHR